MPPPPIYFGRASQPAKEWITSAVATLTASLRRISALYEAGGIRKRLAISTTLILLPCVLAAHVAFIATVRVDHDEARKQVQAEAVDLNQLIAREFVHMRDLGQYLARVEPLLRYEPDRLRSVFEAALGHDANLHIALVESNGQQLFNTRAAKGAILPRVADQAGVERALREQRALLRYVSRGKLTGKSFFTVLVPVQSDSVERVIFVNRTTDHLMAQIAEQLPNKAWHVTVLDSSHRTVLTNADRTTDDLAPPDLLPGVPLTSADRNGTTFTSYLRGKETDWTVVVTANARDAVKGQWSLLVILQIAAVLLSLGIALWTARGFIKPISQLEELAKNLETAAKQPLPALGIAEVRHAAEALVRTGTVLQQSRERLASILASASDAIVCVDRRHRITLFNDQAVVLFGCTRQVMLGRPIGDFLSIDLAATALECDSPRIEECIGRRGKDDEFTAELSIARPVDDDEYHYSLIVRDVTLRQRVALENARLAVVVESSADAIISLALDHTVLTWNTSAERLLGYSAREIVGQSYLCVIPGELEDQYQRNCERMRNGEVVSLVAPRRHKDGHQLWVEVSAAPLRDASGIVVGISTVLRDISDKIEATTLQHRLAAIVDASADAIIGLAPDCTVMTWNKASEKLFGYAPEEIIGESLSILFPVAERVDVEEKVQQGCQSGSTSTDVERMRKDGTAVTVAGTAAAIRDADGKTTGFSIVYRDMTESKRHVQQMRIIMRELSHRAKNLLAAISAMARSSTNSAPDIATYVEDFSSRLHGLSRSHDLLVRKEWIAASLRSLVEEQLQPFVFKSSNQLRLEGVDIALNPAAAQMIGLALHELATNAVKHGAFSRAAGTVSITWKTDTDENGSPRVDLVWQESGGPPVTPPVKIGFGREVLEEMLAESLDGSTTLTFARSGVIWHLHAPLSTMEAMVSSTESNGGLAKGQSYAGTGMAA